MDKADYNNLINKKIKYLSLDENSKKIDLNLNNSIILSGSFNPLHKGHKELLIASEKEYKIKPLFEISIFNFDKKEINFIDLTKRIEQFKSQGKIIITNSPTFNDKSSIFKKSIFVVGYDTALRLIKKKYYDHGIQDAYQEIKKNECSFLVSGRYIDKKYYDPKEINFGEFKDFFSILPENKFRLDISSTILRNDYNSAKDKFAA